MHVERANDAPVNATFFYGPFARGHGKPFEGDTFDFNNISTTNFLWGLLTPEGALPALAFVDVRDVAKAHVRALKAPSTSQVGRKRILMSVPAVQATDLTELIKKERPGLAQRLCLEAIENAPHVITISDNKRLKDVLGMEVSPWQKTILDGVDALIELEGHWEARGKPICYKPIEL